MGIGRPETPESFVRACEVFVHTTNLISDDRNAGETTPEDKTITQKPIKDDHWVKTVKKATETASQEHGWAHLAAVGTY